MHKTYKKFFIVTVISMILATILTAYLLIIAGYYFIGRYVYSQGAATTRSWIETKNEFAKEIDKNGYKIVFLSGSNTLHGLNSEYARKISGLPILNYGVHAGLGTYVFEEAKNILKKGDIVIMPLEWSFYSKKENSLESPLAEYIISYDKEYYKRQDFKQKLWLMFFLVRYYVTHPNLSKITTEKDVSLNSYGDFIAHDGSTEKFIKYKSKHMLVSANIPPEYKDLEVYDFIQYCKENDIDLYAMSPVTYHPPSLREKEQKAFAEIKNFYEKNGIEFLDTPQDSFMSDKHLFYDTAYHPNTKGAIIRTEYLVKIAKRVAKNRDNRHIH